MRRLARAIALTGAVLAVTATEASAAATRAEYAAQVNPICAQADAQQKKIFSRLPLPKNITKVQPKKLTNALIGALAKSQRVQVAATARIASIPAAPGDETLVAQWVENRFAIHRLNKRGLPLNAELLRIVDDNEDRKTRARVRKLEKRIFALLGAILNRIVVDSELGTQLGVTRCVTPFESKASSARAGLLLP